MFNCSLYLKVTQEDFYQCMTHLKTITPDFITVIH